MWTDVDREAGGARATAAPTRLLACTRVGAVARTSIGGLDAHLSRDVGDHVVEDAGSDRSRCS